MIPWLDRLTGRVTMYRLIVLCLLALVVVALVLAASGQLFYSPLAIVGTGAVAVAATCASGLIFAGVFRTRAHTESSIITGLLLLFLFQPTLNVAQLGAVALAGVIASASKYLIAVRGRHVLNPAAAGALIVGLFQLNITVWWIATGWLLPFTVIGAFLILYRTNHLALGATFVVVSATIVTISLSAGGSSVATAAGVAFTSYPIVFLAGFMLSEPLTLPPRRWQQLVLAAVVAVLFSVPFSVGPVYSSPELALVVGNILAFFVGQRRDIRLDFLGRTALTASSWEFEFRPHRPVSFAPGQYMELTLPHTGADARGSRRTFSIASPPGERDVVRFGLRMSPRPSTFKRALLTLEPGATISATSVGGDFLLPRDPAKPLLLVAGGIGITPFVSQLEHLESTGEKRDVVLVYAVSSTNEIPYAQRLGAGGHRVLLVSPREPGGAATGEAAADGTTLGETTSGGTTPDGGAAVGEAALGEGTRGGANSGGASPRGATHGGATPAWTVPAGSVPAVSELPANWTWIGEGPLTGDLLLSAVPDARQRDAYVSGPPRLVVTLKRALRRAGLRHVRSDYFSGY
jgi:ferredoxin-NADP reductase